MAEVAAVAIYPDKRVEEVTLRELADYQEIVDGYIEAVTLSFGSSYATMWVNELFAVGKFGPDDFNSIATDVAGLGGRADLLLSGVLGPVIITGDADRNGDTTPITDEARKAIERVAREA